MHAESQRMQKRAHAMLINIRVFRRSARQVIVRIVLRTDRTALEKVRGFIENRVRRVVEVAHRERRLGRGLAQAFDKPAGEACRMRRVATGTGIDLQDVHRSLRWVWRETNRI